MPSPGIVFVAESSLNLHATVLTHQDIPFIPNYEVLCRAAMSIFSQKKEPTISKSLLWLESKIKPLVKKIYLNLYR